MFRDSPTINVMVNAARKAARGLLRDYGEISKLQVSIKGPANFVTNADLKAEKILKADNDNIIKEQTKDEDKIKPKDKKISSPKKAEPTKKAKPAGKKPSKTKKVSKK